MKRTLAILATLLSLPMSAPAAVLYYSLTATGDNGTTGSGTFSFDDSVVTSEYSNFNAQDDMLSFNLTLNVSGGSPSTTSFGLSDVGSESFVLTLSGGTITDFNPGGLNGDGYRSSPMTFNTAELSGNSVLENIHWSYSPVPEPSTYAALAGLGLGGFAIVRRMRRSAKSVAAP
ncbi:MAG: PEP-CTERM sorting domain-containing protein [Verrucomicrobiales bacterium]|nr:PEP-CTERM sorting domain-containing protein [Verrucomicrobiales bacterium]